MKTAYYKNEPFRWKVVPQGMSNALLVILHNKDWESLMVDKAIEEARKKEGWCSKKIFVLAESDKQHAVVVEAPHDNVSQGDLLWKTVTIEDLPQFGLPLAWIQNLGFY